MRNDVPCGDVVNSTWCWRIIS